MRPWIHTSLAAKFNLVAVCLIALTVLVAGGFAVRQRASQVRQELERRGLELAENVGQTSPYAIYREDARELRRILDQLRIQPGVVYVRILNTQGIAMARALSRPGVAIPSLPLDERIRAGVPRVTQIEDPKAEQAHLDIVFPVQSLREASGQRLLAELPPGSHLPRVVGYLQLGLSTEPIRDAGWEFLASLAAAGAFVLLAGAGLVHAFSRRLTRPLRQLAALSRDIADGNFEQRVDVVASGEVGELADALDLMLTHLRGYRDQVASHQHTLETQVQERTLELRRRTEEAVELAERAEEASRAKSQFLANMSHEIRTPMNGVLGMTELLLETKLTSRQKKFMNTLQHSARTLLDVINDILDFSKAEAGKLQLEPKPIALRAIVEEVADLLAELAQNKGLELAYFVDDDVPAEVLTDPVRLRQVLMNLVGNAIKFTEKGEVMLRVARVFGVPDPSTGDPASESCWLEFSVTDSGIGIRETDQARIFQSFTQADGSMARRFAGTGLGLAICKQLAMLMGGQLGFDSLEGRGSRFWFRIPVKILSPAETRADRERVQGSPRVLVVVDHPTSRRIVAHHMDSWGAEVIEFDAAGRDGEELRKALRGNESFDVVILDDIVSGMSGLELARTISESARPKPRLIMLTAVGRRASPEEERQAGIDACLAKPTREAELYRVFRDVIEGRVGTRTEHQVHAPTRAVDLPGHGARVLLAEDNDVNQAVAVAMLEALGCEVRAVTNGWEAIECIEHEPFDLVLMDCQMPTLDGLAATQRIREREAQSGGASRLPIVALTAHAMRTDRQQCLEAGMDDYLSKPYRREDLHRILEQWARPGNRGPGRSPAPAGPKPSEDAPTLDVQKLGELESLREDGEDLVSRVINTYLEASGELLRTLQAAVGRGDPRAVASAAHALKSSSAHVGARRLSILCKDLEARGRAGSTAGAEEELAEISAELERVQEGLSTYRFGVRDE